VKFLCEEYGDKAQVEDVLKELVLAVVHEPVDWDNLNNFIQDTTKGEKRLQVKSGQGSEPNVQSLLSKIEVPTIEHGSPQSISQTSPQLSLQPTMTLRKRGRPKKDIADKDIKNKAPASRRQRLNQATIAQSASNPTGTISSAEYGKLNSRLLPAEDSNTYATLNATTNIENTTDPTDDFDNSKLNSYLLSAEDSSTNTTLDTTTNIENTTNPTNNLDISFPLPLPSNDTFKDMEEWDDFDQVSALARLLTTPKAEVGGS